MSGMYNMIFGSNPAAPEILNAINLKQSNIPRFRDAFVSNGEIVVYCRMGEPNRRCWVESANGVNKPECPCAACQMVYNIPKHPNFLRIKDDSFDSTYTTIYYSIPEEHKKTLAQVDIGPWEPEKLWEIGLESITSGKISPELEAFGRKLFTRIREVIDEGPVMVVDPDHKEAK